MCNMDDYSEFKCIECDVNTLDVREYYMIQNDLWEQVNPNKNGMMCIGCVEEKLKRELTPEDFTNCPLNLFSPNKKSERLLKRLGYTNKGRFSEYIMDLYYNFEETNNKNAFDELIYRLINNVEEIADLYKNVLDD